MSAEQVTRTVGLLDEAAAREAVEPALSIENALRREGVSGERVLHLVSW